MTVNELKAAEMATIFRIELLLKRGEKKEYTVDELIELLDKIAEAKDQES